MIEIHHYRHASTRLKYFLLWGSEEISSLQILWWSTACMSVTLSIFFSQSLSWEVLRQRAVVSNVLVLTFLNCFSLSLHLKTVHYYPHKKCSLCGGWEPLVVWLPSLILISVSASMYTILGQCLLYSWSGSRRDRDSSLHDQLEWTIILTSLWVETLMNE